MKKIKDIFAGLFFGFILFVFSFVLLWWNEGNSAKNIAIASYMQKNAVQINAENIQDSNNGQLVAVTGEATTDSQLKDINVELPQTLVLKRTVQMYQWEETEHEDSNGNKTYEYKKEWSAAKIDSNSFHDKKYANPEFPIESKEFYADRAKLGAFDLTSEQIRKISPEKDFEDLPKNSKYSVENGKYFSGTDIQTPNIGDVLISYSYAPSGTNISLIGQQQLNKILPFSYKGKNNHVQYNGALDKNGIIEKFKQENSLITMLLRFFGWILMFIGLKLLISPIDAIFGVIPFFGKIVDNISTFIVLLISLGLSLITIAIAWFAYRPVLSIILIAISIGIAKTVKEKLPKNN